MNLKKLNKRLNREFGGKVTASFKENTCSYDESGKPNDDASVVISGELDSWEDILRACSMAVDPKTSKTGCLQPVHYVVNDINLMENDINPVDNDINPAGGDNNSTENDEACEKERTNTEKNGALSIKGLPLYEKSMRLPLVNDNELDEARPDILIIGGGISGASIARELSKWNLDILLVDKESDLAMQASGRNDGEVHPGVDLSHPSRKLKYVRAGNAIYDKVCAELGVPFKWVGQYVGFKGKYLKPMLEIFAAKRRALGVSDTRIIGAKELYKAQPNMNPGYDFAIYNERVGIVCPYGLTIAYAENAAANGVRVSLNTAVLSIKTQNSRIISVETNRGTIYPKLLINAAGTFADVIAEMANDRFYSIHPRRGTNSILDKKRGNLTPSIVSFKTISKASGGHTKGGGILHTAHGNILVGPDAVETYERENFETNPESIKNVFDKQRIAVGELSERDIITYFTGVRAPSFEEDFVIEKGRNVKNMIHVAGIQSPGLTAAPAIALDVEKLAIEMLQNSEFMTKTAQDNYPKALKDSNAEIVQIRIMPNPDYDPIRVPIPELRNMSEKERAAKIAENPDYGIVICRCEEISKGEIIDALKRPVCVPTLDGIKRRVRPGMGRCQGGFCSPLVTKIIAEQMRTDICDITKCGNASKISFGKTKA